MERSKSKFGARSTWQTTTCLEWIHIRNKPRCSQCNLLVLPTSNCQPITMSCSSSNTTTRQWPVYCYHFKTWSQSSTTSFKNNKETKQTYRRWFLILTMKLSQKFKNKHSIIIILSLFCVYLIFSYSLMRFIHNFTSNIEFFFSV